MGLADIASSVLSGGLTGIFGVVVQRIADYKNKQLDLEMNKQKSTHELEMRKLDSQILEKEYTARVEISAIEAQGRESVADSHAFAASYNLEPKLYSDPKKANTRGQIWLMLVLDFIRGIVRPGLTVFLCILTTLMYFKAQELLGSHIAEDRAAEIVKEIVSTILYLSTSCVMWYFGSRNRASEAIARKQKTH